MEIRVFKDKAEISGYVNIPERISKRLREHGSEFYEKINEGVFGDAIRRNDNIKLLLNHDSTRQLASTKDNLHLTEDNVGLFARATITDEDVVAKARSGNLSGWSFGFSPLKESVNDSYGDYPLRSIESLNLYEVSILDSNHIPAYNSMSLEVRDMGVGTIETRSSEKLNIVVEKLQNEELEQRDIVDNSFFINKINDLLNERK